MPRFELSQLSNKVLSRPPALRQPAKERSDPSAATIRPKHPVSRPANAAPDQSNPGPGAAIDHAENAYDHNTNHPRQASKLEPNAGVRTLAESEAEKEDSSRILVRVTSARKRLCDEDNLCEKPTVDCLRYCGAIPGDEPEAVGISTGQRKVKEGEAEHTEITVTYPE